MLKIGNFSMSEQPNNKGSLKNRQIGLLYLVLDNININKKTGDTKLSILYHHCNITKMKRQTSAHKTLHYRLLKSTIPSKFGVS